MTRKAFLTCVVQKYDSSDGRRMTYRVVSLQVFALFGVAFWNHFPLFWPVFATTRSV